MLYLARGAACVFALWSVLGVHAWSSAGHEIVATIAQAFLLPDVRVKLCGILPNYTAYEPAQGAVAK